MEKMIICRRIWYLMTLLSLLGLYISIDHIWRDCKSSSRFLRDGAVSATAFYVVMLFRYAFFTDHHSSSNYKDKEFITLIERLPQATFSYFSFGVLIFLPIMYTTLMEEFVVYVSLFTISVFTGGIGLMQLSDKFRMEMRHAFLTLFLGWLLCLSGILLCWLYVHDTQKLAWLLGFMFCQLMVPSVFLIANLNCQEVHSTLHGRKVDSEDTLALPLLV